jgi:hypothetical protein
MEKENGRHRGQERTLRFLITLNMPSFEGRLVHQVTLGVHGVDSVADFWKMLNDYEFILGTQWYRRKDPYTGAGSWEDRGELILNTSHIGKIAEFIELEEEYDESQRSFEFRSRHSQGPRRPIRP